MKKMLKNKKGFTLVELLAVIVILAIIMVIATQQIGKVISDARSNSFIDTYQMVVKQIKTYIAEDDISSILCDSSTDASCLKKYDLSDDYSLVVSGGTDVYEIHLGAAGVVSTAAAGGGRTIKHDGTPTAGKKFANLDLIHRGNAKNTDADATTCTPASVGATAKDCGATWIKGEVEQ